VEETTMFWIVLLSHLLEDKNYLIKGELLLRIQEINPQNHPDLPQDNQLNQLKLPLKFEHPLPPILLSKLPIEVLMFILMIITMLLSIWQMLLPSLIL
jgi:hypothetical protein